MVTEKSIAYLVFRSLRILLHRENMAPIWQVDLYGIDTSDYKHYDSVYAVDSVFT